MIGKRGGHQASSTTIVVTFIRLLLIVTPHLSSHFLSNHYYDYYYFINSIGSSSSPLVRSILVRPLQTLLHIQEANAIRKLLSGRFVNVYQAHQTICLPPLVLAAALTLLPLNKEHQQESSGSDSSSSGGLLLSPELCLSLFLLVVDILISYFLQALGTELLISPPPPRKQQQKQQDVYAAEEDRLQLLLPSAIQPPNGDIFPLTSNSRSESEEEEDMSSSSSSSSTQPLFPLVSLPTLASQLYYWSPVTILASGTFHCFQNVSCLLLLMALYEACKKQRNSLSLATFSLALATYLEPHYCVFLVPIVLYSSKAQTQQQQQQYQKASLNLQQFKCILWFVVWSVIFQGLSYTLVGPADYWNVMNATYGVIWKNMSPNLSLLWYFQIQLFTRFRSYFAMILTGLPYVLIVPLTTRLYKYPMALVAIFWFLWTIFRPDQTLFDLNVGLCFFLFSPRSMARINLPIFCIILSSLWVPVILNVLDLWMWLETSSGNANYIYFQCLGYNAFLGILVGQFCSATLQRDKALRMTAKSLL